MIAEKALSVAGPDAHLVARPRGVAHVYIGPLTPSGRAVPRARRALCRTRTRRLTTVHFPRGWSSLAPEPVPSVPSLCARCSASLGVRSRAGEAGQHLTRREYLLAYADLTPFDLVLAARAADTVDELDQVAHLSLALFGHRGCTEPVTRPDGQQLKPLHDHVISGRTRVGGWPADVAAAAERHDLLSEQATEIRRARARATRKDKDRAWEATRAPRATSPTEGVHP